MHPTALSNADLFFKTYLVAGKPHPFLVEVGSQDVNGSIRQVCPDRVEYVGVDFSQGKGVDVVLDDPYSLPFATDSVDYCVCSSVFEHSEMFWLLFLEILRILTPDGVFYLNVPSNGKFHRYPVDCWRFYPDSGKALVNWAKRNGYSSALLESFTSYQKADCWNDYVAVFIKDVACVGIYETRMINSHTEFANGLVLGSDVFINPTDRPEDMVKVDTIAAIATGQLSLR